MKILLLVRALGFGGAERQVVGLARGLARRGHRVTIAAFYPGDAFDRSAFGANPELLVIGKRGRWDIVGFLWRLVCATAAQRPEIIYSFLPMPNLLAAVLRSACCRRAALVWGLRGTPLEPARYDRLERLSLRLERLAARLPDLVIANSHAGAAWAGSPAFGARRVVTVANGIDPDMFRPATIEQRRAARALLRCPEGAFVVAVVARFDPMKDHATFFEAFAAAAPAAPALFGLIAGDGPPPLVVRLHAHAARLGIGDRLIWVGQRRRVIDIYHAADLLCLPSAFGEGFPNVVGEAMACGLPCIVTAVGDSAVVVGSAGAVVPPRDPAVLARAIVDAANRIGADRPTNYAARCRIVRNFSPDAMIAATERALGQVIAERRRHGGRAQRRPTALSD